MLAVPRRPHKVSYLLRHEEEAHHRLGVNSLAVHPSGGVLTAGRDADIRLWTLDEGVQV